MAADKSKRRQRGGAHQNSRTEQLRDEIIVEAEVFDRGLHRIGSNDLHLHVGLGKGRQRTDEGSSFYSVKRVACSHVRVGFLTIEALFLANVIINISMSAFADRSLMSSRTEA